ncbi:dipeptide ABC transporter ATP-binding protein [Streptomyces venezuelae]|uniref:dipeptide ABC transporter ATP-binding protein n=1 Tax=Streptomyces venezuelae TaxID=54571 RepID=UPI00364B9296
MTEHGTVLRVRDLTVRFAGRGGPATAVEDISFTVARGEVLGLVGESGSGKSTVALAAMGLHDPARTTVRGSVEVGGVDVVTAGEDRLKGLRGGRIAMVFQDALASLSPFHRVGAQLAEAYRIHHGDAGREEAWARAVEMLERVGIDGSRARDHPHQFSGGMRQRVMIAMALINRPDVLIADEPTTALDAPVQRQVLDLMNELRRDFGTAVVLVTHDVGMAAEATDRLLVMRGGRGVETGPTRRVLGAPAHPYTRALVGAAPSLDSVPGSRLPTVDDPRPARRVKAPERRPREEAAPLAEVTDLRVEFGGGRTLFARRREPTRAVRGVSLRVAEGETLGLVGESGSGKSTTARVLAGLQRPSGGTVRFDGRDVTRAAEDAALRRSLSREVQLVFQDPYASLNPRRTVEEIVTTPLRVHTRLGRGERRDRAAELLAQVGLGAADLTRYPHEFSGGQRQRIGIARALAPRPRLIIADEPVSALDVSVQAQVLNLLMDLRDELNLSLLFVSHDLAVVRHLCDRIAVMRRGAVVESGTRDDIFDAPREPYTKELLAARL